MTAAVELVELADIEVGRRAFRPGDTVQVRPSRHGHHDGFTAVLQRIQSAPDGSVVVTVFGARGSRCPAFRTFPADRITAPRRGAR